jgi:hypothetical protein
MSGGVVDTAVAEAGRRRCGGEARTAAGCLVRTGGGGVNVDKAPVAVVGEIGVFGDLVTTGDFSVIGTGSASRGDFEFANILDEVLDVLV